MAAILTKLRQFIEIHLTYLNVAFHLWPNYILTTNFAHYSLIHCPLEKTLLKNVAKGPHIYTE